VAENSIARKTIQLDHVMDRQPESWLYVAFLQFVSSVGVTVNLMCWYFWKFGVSVGTLKWFAFITKSGVYGG
jgi:hypothetical protein